MRIAPQSCLGHFEDYGARASCVTVPLWIGSGMRYQILEAFALGRAVVSTSLGAEGIEITEGENIVIRDDPGQFGDSVARCLTDAVFRDGLGRSTRIPAEEKYSWPAIASRFASVIQTIGDNDALRNPA